VRLRRIIQAVRDHINDRDAKYWKDGEIVFWISHHARNLTRTRVNADDSYGQHLFEIQASDKTRVESIGSGRIHTRYYLPSWVYRIYSVRDGSGSQGRQIMPIFHRHSRRERGWVYSGDRTIDLIGMPATDLEIEAVKMPPILHYGCVRVQSADATQVVLDHLPVDPTLEETGYFDFDWETDAYVGVELEFTGLESATRTPKGRVVVIKAQTRVYDSSVADYVLVCQIMPHLPFAPRRGDTYEMHVPVDESGLEYLAALVAFSLFKRTKNLEGMATLRRDLEMGRVMYIDSLQPRQEQAPRVMEFEGGEGIGIGDVDRDFILE
jgi:hypothetical protein